MPGSEPRVLVLGLGGTVSMTSDPDGAVPTQSSAELLRRAGISSSVETRDLQRVPGAHLTIAHVIELVDVIAEAAAAGVTGVVVTTGTDTLEEVAYALDLLVGATVHVVVTGAMRPASAAGADGPANLLDAIAVASRNEPLDLGVTVVIAGEVHAASLVRKAHTVAPHALASDPGPIGTVTEGRPHMALRPARLHRLPLGSGSGPDDPNVATVVAMLGSDERALGHLEHGVDAVVVEGFGGGHVPPSWVSHLERLAATRPVVLCSRVERGPTLTHTYGFPGSERDLLARGVLRCGALSAAKAVMALRLMLRAGTEPAAIGGFFAGLA